MTRQRDSEVGNNCDDGLVVEWTPYCDRKADIDTIRIQVFHQEQQIDPALDFDGLDPGLPQVVAYLQTRPLGTARLRFNSAKTQVKLERVAVLANYRRRGIGRAMVHTIITELQRQPVSQLMLHAQHASIPFYQALGFTPQGQPFMEAGIEHIEMVVRLGP